jgi:hypothetical protein
MRVPFEDLLAARDLLVKMITNRYHPYKGYDNLPELIADLHFEIVDLEELAKYLQYKEPVQNPQKALLNSNVINTEEAFTGFVKDSPPDLSTRLEITERKVQSLQAQFNSLAAKQMEMRSPTKTMSFDELEVVAKANGMELIPTEGAMFSKGDQV